MLIVSGRLYVDASTRQDYLDSCLVVIDLARQAPGCLDFHLSADPVEPGRINVYEQWESVADVESFRGSGPSEEQGIAILDAAVFQHEVASSERL